jgi:predicted RNase H-like HicB family nuclease
MARIIMLVHETNAVFGASFPDFPGCTTVADSLEDLFIKAPVVLDFHVRGLRDDRIPVSEPRSLEAMLEDPVFLGDKADAILVTSLDLDVTGSSVSVGVAFSEGAIASIDRAAKQLGETRAQFIAEAALMRVGQS